MEFLNTEVALSRNFLRLSFRVIVRSIPILGFAFTKSVSQTTSSESINDLRLCRVSNFDGLLTTTTTTHASTQRSGHSKLFPGYQETTGTRLSTTNTQAHDADLSLVVALAVNDARGIMLYELLCLNPDQFHVLGRVPDQGRYLSL